MVPRPSADYDLVVVGGGINGAGIARDAAGRGLSTLLCERDDLGAHTSSASTKLIHGGLRYLEHFEFGMVRKALREREVLLRAAPHLIRPLRFVLPHGPGQRPAWMIWAGLFLYDRLAPRQLLEPSALLDLQHHPAGAALRPGTRRAFSYADGWVDDARLVVVNALDAAERGAHVRTRTECVQVRRIGAHWVALLRAPDGAQWEVRARALVNAAGPWSGRFLTQVAAQPKAPALRLIRGSHLVVPRLFDHADAYLLQNADGRVVFAIPYEGRYTLLGTTDVEHEGDPGSARVSPAEVDYLCRAANAYLRTAVTPADVVWSYTGVRPLLDDAAGNPSAITRDYRLELDGAGPPLLSVLGGKLTTYRKLAEEAVDIIAGRLSNTHGRWTAQACLPGGDLLGPSPSNEAVRGFPEWVRDLGGRYPWLPTALRQRYASAYGTRIHALLAGRRDLAALGPEIAPGLFAAEVEYLVREEWACSAEDILWRRTKLGLHLTLAQAEELAHWMTCQEEAAHGPLHPGP